MADPKNTLPPELHNDEQEDEDTQAQAIADEARGRSTSSFGLEDSEKPRGSSTGEDDTQDLVDHMKQMETSGSIDMSAYRGEPNHDDNVEKYGAARRLRDTPADGDS